MERREAIRNTALILGYAVSASTITAVLNGCTSDATSTETTSDQPWSPEFFDQDEITLIDEISEVILPATTTPGARDAEVYKYVDVIIARHTDSIGQGSFRNGLVELDMECKEAYGVSFLKCSAEQRLEYLQALDKEANTYMQENNGRYRPWFSRMKELTWIGFFTSELIGENYLNYDPVPGVYQGCIPLDETGGKAWSL